MTKTYEWVTFKKDILKKVKKTMKIYKKFNLIEDYSVLKVKDGLVTSYKITYECTPYYNELVLNEICNCYE